MGYHATQGPSFMGSREDIGIKSKQGKYGGTYAHPVIACEFLTWISPRFKYLMIQTLSIIQWHQSRKSYVTPWCGRDAVGMNSDGNRNNVTLFPQERGRAVLVWTLNTTRTGSIQTAIGTCGVCQSRAEFGYRRLFLPFSCRGRYLDTARRVYVD